MDVGEYGGMERSLRKWENRSQKLAKENQELKAEIEGLRREVTIMENEMERFQRENDKIVELYKKLNNDLKRECRIYMTQIQNLTQAPPQLTRPPLPMSGQSLNTQNALNLEDNPTILMTYDDPTRLNPFSKNFELENAMSNEGRVH